MGKCYSSNSTSQVFNPKPPIQSISPSVTILYLYAKLPTNTIYTKASAHAPAPTHTRTHTKTHTHTKKMRIYHLFHASSSVGGSGACSGRHFILRNSRGIIIEFWWKGMAKRLHDGSQYDPTRGSASEPRATEPDPTQQLNPDTCVSTRTYLCM